MSAIATADGTKEAERVGQLTIPPTITTIRNTSESVPMKAARSPCRASGTRAATEPAVMIRRLYHHFNGNTVDQRLTRIPPTELVFRGRSHRPAAAATSRPERGRTCRESVSLAHIGLLGSRHEDLQSQRRRVGSHGRAR